MPRKLSQEERKVSFRHTIDKLDGLKLEFTDSQTDRLSNLFQAVDDIERASACIKKVVSLQRAFKGLDDLVVSALWQKAVMSYGRCFNRPIKLQATSIYKSPEALAFHQEIKDLRDKYIGHQGSHQRTARGVVIVVRHSKKGYRPEFHGAGIGQMGNYLNPAQTLRHFKLLIAVLNAEMQSITASLGRVVMDEPMVLRWIVRREKANGSKLFDHIELDLLPAD